MVSRNHVDTFQWMKRLQQILSTKGITGLSEPCIFYFRMHRRHLLGGIFVIWIFFALSVHTVAKTKSKLFVNFLDGSELPLYEKWQQITEDEDKILPHEHEDCLILKPTYASTRISPVLVPLFPSLSSDDVIRSLIEAVTGLLTSRRSYRDDVVAIKTHYPYHTKHVSINHFKANELSPPKAIILIRDPLETMEVWHNWILNTINNLDINNPTTLQSWRSWRDNHFEQEINQWALFYKYWLENIPLESRILLSYEQILDEKNGPLETFRIAQFLKKVGKISITSSSDAISCIWYKVTNHLNQKVESEIARPYTYQQLDHVAVKITELLDSYALEAAAKHALINYRKNVMGKIYQMKRIDPVLVTNKHGSCIVSTPIHEKVTPIYQASYLGSGSEMLRELIEAITGIKTGDTLKSRKKGVVAIKTNYPTNKKDTKLNFWNQDMTRALLLVRNPLSAMSSLFNHINEHNKGLVPHSSQAPVHEWEAWRDENFEKELNLWAEHLKYWLSSFRGNNLHIISYEAMTNELHGPVEATSLSEFLGEYGTNVDIHTAPVATVPCLWFRVAKVLDKSTMVDSQQGENLYQSNKHRPRYTNMQLEKASTFLNELHTRYADIPNIGPILRYYWKDSISLIV